MKNKIRAVNLALLLLASLAIIGYFEAPKSLNRLTLEINNKLAIARYTNTSNSEFNNSVIKIMKESAINSYNTEHMNNVGTTVTYDVRRLWKSYSYSVEFPGNYK